MTFKALTDREKALISFAASQQLQGIKSDWTAIYQLSRDKALKSAIIAPSSAAAASAWKCSARVADFFRSELQRLELWKQQQIQDAISDYNQNLLQHGINIDQLLADADISSDVEDNNITSTSCDGGALEPKFGARSGGGKNYADRQTMMLELNRIARNAKDSKERLDALKIIADLQRFKDTATTEKPEIKRFYMPLRCSDCEIYKKRKVRYESENQ